MAMGAARRMGAPGRAMPASTALASRSFRSMVPLKVGLRARPAYIAVGGTGGHFNAGIYNSSSFHSRAYAVSPSQE